MASLIEELVNVLEAESAVYQQLFEYGKEKRQVLIEADVPALEKITDFEQEASSTLLSYSNKQLRILKDIANVLGKPEDGITVTKLIGYLESQPKERDSLLAARDRLIKIANDTQDLNQQNEILLRQAIELTEFDLTLFKSLRQAPETANYNKSATNTGTLLGNTEFDAKQ